jgi:hypothetical protein
MLTAFSGSMHNSSTDNSAIEDPRNPHGIVIHDRVEEPRPAIIAFIWGGKVRPVPALPYGRPTAA